MVSVSTKFATFPSSSMPRELNLVPARLQDSLDIKVKLEGRLVLTPLIGEEEDGTVIVETNPLIAEVRIWEESRSSFSFSASLERNLIRGSII